MTDDQITKAMEVYKKKLQSMGIEPRQVPFDQSPKNYIEVLSHALSMIEELPEMIWNDERERVMRWLGWIQCSVWLAELFTIDELMDHNQ